VSFEGKAEDVEDGILVIVTSIAYLDMDSASYCISCGVEEIWLGNIGNLINLRI